MSIPDNFSLDDFALAFINAAVEVARSDPTVDEFDEQVKIIMCDGHGYAGDLVTHLHHSLYWNIINQDGKFPLQRYFQDNGPNGVHRIKLNGKCDEREIIVMKDEFLLKRDYLEARVESYYEN